MKSNPFNLLKNIPSESKDEIFETIIENNNMKIERIVSYAHVSPNDFWYNQDEDEFVLVLQGKATIKYDDGSIFDLKVGDSLYIKAHQKHKVTYTQNPTIWLAVFIK